MGYTSFPLVFTLLLVAARLTSAQQPELHCYGLATQIGTAARQVFRDANGFIVRAIYYTSTEGMRPSCAEGTLRIHSTTTYERDARGRAIVETDAGPAGNVGRVWRIDYAGDNTRPSRRTQFGPDGMRQYEIRYDDGREVSHIYYNEQERVISISPRGLR